MYDRKNNYYIKTNKATTNRPTELRLVEDLAGRGHMLLPAVGKLDWKLRLVVFIYFILNFVSNLDVQWP